MPDYYQECKDIVRAGWRFHQQQLNYHCGYCGTKVSTILGLERPAQYQGVDARWDVRYCTHCYYATNLVVFCGDIRYQNPKPRLGESFRHPKNNEDVSIIINLYNEARSSMTQDCPSCAVLMFRKLLMHIAVQKQAKKDCSFQQYCDYLKNTNVVGKPQYDMLDRIKNAGNAENHEIRHATNEEAKDLIEIVTLLIKSIYIIQ